jgi:hypothetical protein
MGRVDICLYHVSFAGTPQRLVSFSVWQVFQAPEPGPSCNGRTRHVLLAFRVVEIDS